METCWISLNQQRSVAYDEKKMEIGEERRVFLVEFRRRKVATQTNLIGFTGHKTAIDHHINWISQFLAWILPGQFGFGRFG